MTNLVSAVPPHEPADDALAFAGRAALGVIPLVGPIAAETLAHALDTRQAERQHGFNLKVAYALTEALERLDASLTVEDVVDSDEFVAAVTRAQRAAAETASEAKRRRLASAVVNGGSWAPFSASEREQFKRLVDDFDELHVFLLHYFVDPRVWLEQHGMLDRFDTYLSGSVDTPLSFILSTDAPDWSDTLTQAVGDLERAGLGEFPLRRLTTTDGMLASRTSDRGRRFLEFVGEPTSAEVDAP